MDSSLLATKVQIPPAPRDVLPRKRLSEMLEQAIPTQKLILLSAPAGYGKTTLLTQWAHMSNYRIAWYAIDQDDNDLERFLRYLFLAWEKIQPAVSNSPFGLRVSSMSPDHDATLTGFVNVANNITHHTIFVLDDYHLIQDAAIHHAMTFLLDHLPAQAHFVLSGRAEPPLPLARYRARRKMLELGTDELRFLPEETLDLLKQQTHFSLSAEDVHNLNDQAEGWIAGLQLMALGLKNQSPLSHISQQFTISGRHRYIADYLREDVFSQRSGDLQLFMLQTGIVDRLCASLCNKITGQDNGQEMLEHIEGENLFLAPLDSRREWYRYHHLFAEFLREELHRRHPDTVATLHQRAASWYIAHDLPEEAFRHALDGRDVELVVQVLERFVVTKLMRGEIKLVQKWLHALPDEWRSSHPMIGFVRAGILLVTGQFDACDNCLDEVEQVAREKSKHPKWELARVTAMRCNIACFKNDLARAESLADQALENLPEDDLSFRPGVFGALGDTYRRNGYWQKAQACYRKLLDYTHAPTFRVQAVHVFGSLADLALQQGHLREAAGYWQRALSAIEEQANWGNYPLPLTGWVYIRMGELLYEWNKLADAWEHLSQGLERAELGGDVRALIAGYLLAGRLRLTEDDSTAAAEYLEQVRPLVERAQFVHWRSRFERFQLEVWLAQDRLRAAVSWSDEMLRDVTIEDGPESGIAQLAMARVLIVKGDASAIDRALTLLDQLHEMAAEQGRLGIAIEAQAIQALAQWRRGERTDAMISIEHALRLAEPEGYLRRFADLGLSMARLLNEARSREIMPDYVDELLDTFGADFAFSPHKVLAEPLTEREQEVLELIAAGLTNPEIAEKLVISTETVKKHAGNIYGKLSVSNRTEAATRARELNLLP